VYGEEKAAEYKQKLREASPERIQKIPSEETWPEQQIRAFLESSGVAFESQHPMGYCLVDFYVPSARLVIHADGDYWHGNPDLYPEPTDRQVNRRRLDASIDGWLRNRGYRSVRIWESDLRVDPEKCYRRINRSLE
jgi:very-short-patch-repair endonuclease